MQEKKFFFPNLKKISSLFHISFDYDRVPLKRDGKNGKNFYTLRKKVQKILKIFKVVVNLVVNPDLYIIYRYGSRRANNL